MLQSQHTAAGGPVAQAGSDHLASVNAAISVIKDEAY